MYMCMIWGELGHHICIIYLIKLLRKKGKKDLF